MTRIQKSGDQYRITIPVEIMNLTGWTKGDEMIFVPYITDPDRTLNPDTPILLKRIRKTEKGEPNVDDITTTRENSDRRGEK